MGWWARIFLVQPINGTMAVVLRLSGIPSGSKTEDAIVQLLNAQLFKTRNDEDVLFLT
jgi:hypothetical protein